MWRASIRTAPLSLLREPPSCAISQISPTVQSKSTACRKDGSLFVRFGDRKSPQSKRISGEEALSIRDHRFRTYARWFWAVSSGEFRSGCEMPGGACIGSSSVNAKGATRCGTQDEEACSRSYSILAFLHCATSVCVELRRLPPHWEDDWRKDSPKGLRPCVYSIQME